MGDIVGLHGSASGFVGEADAAVIELIERWLDKARRGELVAVAIIGVQPNNHVGTAWVNPAVSLHQLISGASTLQYRLNAENPSLE